VRLGHAYKLIDLDAAVASAIEHVGLKCSSAYVPPEMLAAVPSNSALSSGGGASGLSSGSTIVLRSAANVAGTSAGAGLAVTRSATKRGAAGCATAEKSYHGVAPLVASPSFDLWSLGCTLFYMITGQTLLHADTCDNAASDAQVSVCTTCE
jgi:serine/threonine protein kinase